MAISGFTRQVWLSLFPFGNTFKIAISTILSVATLIPVVSRSKKQIGFFKLSSIILFCSAKILFIEVLKKLIKKKRGFCLQNPRFIYQFNFIYLLIYSKSLMYPLLRVSLEGKSNSLYS